MAILDTIKKKLHTAEAGEMKNNPVKKNPKTKEKVQDRSFVAQREAALFNLLKSPHITEKSSAMQVDGKYIFKVSKATNKNEIRKAMESIFKVKVTDINIINARKKRVRLGKHEGWSGGFKKAIVTLKKGDKIVTIGGIHGKIEEVKDTTLIITVEGGGRLKIEKSAISQEFSAGQNAEGELAKN